MKFVTIICGLALMTLVACEKDKEPEELSINTGLNGSWVQIARGYSIGGPMIHAPVEEGQGYNLYFGRTEYKSNIPQEKYNSYFKDSLTVTLVNSKSGDKFKYSYMIINDTLTLSPLTIMCFEGCYTKYKRVEAGGGLYGSIGK